MKIFPLHEWNLTPAEAVALQKTLADRVDLRSPLGRFDLVAGADVSYQRHGHRLFGGVIVLRTDDLSVVEQHTVCESVRFPYVPGLLSFREAPVVLAAFEKLRTQPDVVLLDGQGYAHPRRFGLACHLGLWLGLPTLGCAKTLLVGSHGRLGAKAGSVAPLKHQGEVVGMAVRTRTSTRPVYVSAGHKIDLASAVEVVLATCRGYRIPEPTRQAHLVVNEARRRGCSDVP
ncbi:MAG: deoxyribonuclease V [Gemmatales bacterium]|nr:deoxyribonuclease V [Gemmatales bacterium]MDW8387686.1 deoxyribonuclease V [Gemmatales bacterium]